jgi:hypothetical protein
MLTGLALPPNTGPHGEAHRGRPDPQENDSMDAPQHQGQYLTMKPLALPVTILTLLSSACSSGEAPTEPVPSAQEPLPSAQPDFSRLTPTCFIPPRLKPADRLGRLRRRVGTGHAPVE